jgi:hypothetical protein
MKCGSRYGRYLAYVFLLHANTQYRVHKEIVRHRKNVLIHKCQFSVADSGCLSQILIFIHPGSRIQQQQKRGGKQICCPTFWSQKHHKIKIIYFFTGTGKNLSQFT